MPQKILIIHEQDVFSPQAAGAEIQVRWLSEMLRDYGHNVLTLCFGSKAQCHAHAITLVSPKSSLGRLFSRVIPTPKIIFEICRTITHFQPDVIHLHNINIHTGAILKAVRGHNVIHTAHDFRLLCPSLDNLHTDNHPCLTGATTACWHLHRRENSWPTFLAKTALFLLTRHRIKRSVKRFTAPSPILKSLLEKQGYKPVALVLNHISEPSLPPLFSEGTRFLFVGKFEKNKGVLPLLHAFIAAQKRRPELTLELVGDGRLRAELEALRQKSSFPKNIDIRGWQRHLAETYQRADVVVVPSIWMEAFCLVAAEAMSYGKPLLVSNRGALPWLVTDGVEGRIFDPGKSRDLEEKLLAFATNPGTMKAMGENAFRRYQSLQRGTIENWLSLYE